MNTEINPNDPYEQWRINRFKHWDLQVFERQEYLGRAILWARRENALDLTEANLNEQKELFEILPIFKQAVFECFGSNWINIEFLGNESPHLHCHLIPRYKTSKVFCGQTFTDPCFGKRATHNYTLKTDILIQEAVLDRYLTYFEKLKTKD